MKSNILRALFQIVEVNLNLHLSALQKPLCEIEFIDAGEWRENYFNGTIHSNFDHFYLVRNEPGDWRLLRDRGSTQEWKNGQRTTVRVIERHLSTGDALLRIQEELNKARKKTGHTYRWDHYYGRDTLPNILKRLRRGEGFSEPEPMDAQFPRHAQPVAIHL
jgi:hypothetical protein